MPDLSTTHQLVAYMAWANDVVLRNAERAPHAELTRSRPTLFGSITGTFDHVLVVSEIFAAHLAKRVAPHCARQRSKPIPFADVARRLREIDGHFVAMARDSTTDELENVIDFEFVDGGKGAMTKRDILLHLVNHATYHRGFVSTLLYPIIGDSTASDLTVFLRDVWHGRSGETNEAGER